MAILYEEHFTEPKTVEHTFIAVEDDLKKKIRTRAYTGKSFEELLVAVEDFWDMVDEHDMLRPSKEEH